MNKREARAIAEGRIEELRRLSYGELQAFLDPQTEERVGASGSVYQVQTKAVWDDWKEGDLRVFVLIDDGG